MYRNIVWMAVLCTTLNSCDVPGLIYFKNKTDSTARIVYKSSDGSIGVVRDFEINCKPDTTTLKVFGFGYWWTNKLIEDYSRSIDTFRISTSQYQYIITDSLTMTNYLKSIRSKGLFKASLTVKLPLKQRKVVYFRKQEVNSIN